MAVETRTRMSEEAYERLALAEIDRKWELRNGNLFEKPGMTAWRRQPVGSYSQSTHREGVIRPVALPGVDFDLAVWLTR